MRCACGVENKDTNTFCTECGKRLIRGTPAADLDDQTAAAQPDVTRMADPGSPSEADQEVKTRRYESHTVNTDQTIAKKQSIPTVWKVGDVILDLYEVKEILGEGGFGRVYKVHHREWNTELAVKSPRAEQFETNAHQENFVRECETWIQLGMHPHIVSCYYVRTIGKVPHVFAEYVEGGSLQDWIEDRRLYQGGKDEVLRRILDISIQFAWGLHYAHTHEQGLVHQDVKPANLLITPEGEAKVTDFGLARARSSTDMGIDEAKAGRTVLVTTGGMTPAYCSPEQAEGKPLSRKTDIWSWALSVLEMFTGERTWRSGTLAMVALDEYHKAGADDESIPRMPDALAKLLKECFQQDPENRPKDFQEIVTVLRSIYKNKNNGKGGEYPRKEPEEAKLLADSLNNRGLSLLDLGKMEEADVALSQALQSDPKHPEANYNLGLIQWRASQLTDDELVSRMKGMRANRSGGWREAFLLGLVHIERGDSLSAVHLLERSIGQAKTDPEVDAALKVANAAMRNGFGSIKAYVGHKGPVESIAFLPDCSGFLSASWDRTIRKWDAKTGECTAILKGHTAEVMSLAVSENGRQAISGGKYTIFFWDLKNNVLSMKRNSGDVNSVSISSSSGLATSACSDGAIRVWKTETGKEIATLKGHEASVTCVAMCLGGQFAFSGSSDRTVRFWDLRTATCLDVLEGHKDKITCLSASWDGRFVITGSFDGTLRFWDMHERRGIQIRKGHTKFVHSVSLTCNGTLAASAGMDGNVRVYDTSTGRVLRTIHTQAKTAALSTTGELLLWDDKSTSDWAGWDIQSTRIGRPQPQALALCRPRESSVITDEALRVDQARQEAESALASGDSRRAYEAVCAGGSIHGYERNSSLLLLRGKAGFSGIREGLEDAWLVQVLRGHEGGVSSLAWFLGLDAVASAGWDSTVRIWNPVKGNCLRVLKGHVGPVSSVAVTMGGRCVVSGGWDGTLRFWETTSGKSLGGFRTPTEPVCSLAISNDRRHALSGGGDLAIASVLQKADFQSRCLLLHTRESQGMDFVRMTVRIPRDLPRGCSIRAWKLATGQCVKVFDVPCGPVRSLRFSRDDRSVVSVTDDGVVSVWALASGRQINTPGGQKGGALDADLSANWSWVLAAERFGNLTLYETSTGAETRKLRPERVRDGISIRGDGHATCVFIAADVRFAAAGYQDGKVRLWALPEGRYMRTLTGHDGPVRSVTGSEDGRFIVSAGEDGTLCSWELKWEFQFPEVVDWDEGARPYLESFLTTHCSENGLSRAGRPVWNDRAFGKLVSELKLRGYGWLRPEGVKRELEKMASNWEGPPPLPGGMKGERGKK